MNELHLFAGAGGGILGGLLLGHVPVCAVEVNPYCQEVLRARQRDGLLPDFPIFGDIREFDGNEWRGRVDIVAGGFPCQDISVAGKGEGIDGERSGLWGEMARIIGEVRPRYAFVENSPALVGRGLTRVLSDLAALGYDARWTVLGADDVGAPHRRKRIWILAESNGDGCRSGNGRGIVRNELGDNPGAQPGRDDKPTGIDRASQGAGDVADSDCPCRKQSENEADARASGGEGRNAISGGGKDMANTNGFRWDGRARQWDAGGRGEFENGGCQFPNPNGARLAERESKPGDNGQECSPIIRGDWWNAEPGLGRVAHGVARRVDRLTAIGNGQVPAVAALAWRTLMSWEASA